MRQRRSTKLPLAHHLPQVTVCGTDEPDVDGYGLGPSYPDDTAPLQSCKELGLQGVAQIAYFVEEECATLGELHLARLVGLRVGEGSLDMTEKLTLEERLAHGSHIDGHQRTIGTRRETMNLCGKHLLACSVLACDEDIGLCGRYLRP